MARKSPLLLPLGALVLGTLVCVSGCGGSESNTGSGGSGGGAGTDSGEKPANIAGDYTVDLTNQANDCIDMPDWVEGATNEGVPFSIVQKGVKLTAQTMGTSAIYFLLRTGSNAFAGEIHGSHFVLTNYGTKDETYGSCTYTINVVVEGDIDGDAIAGTVTYEPAITDTDNPDCTDYDCAAVQAFSGSRPSN